MNQFPQKPVRYHTCCKEQGNEHCKACKAEVAEVSGLYRSVMPEGAKVTARRSESNKDAFIVEIEVKK